MDEEEKYLGVVFRRFWLQAREFPEMAKGIAIDGDGDGHCLGGGDGTP